ncbi:putative membrane protein [Escherichia coli DEC2B]|uniref:Putative membrane protein n=1 Tax=Escherichia coli DEC2D TaxID=868141 RepID=A0A828U1Y9_ECOLX|nr:putative membrane protein [Escherichia coli 2362-75]EHU04195.1 putative membrane protein [Escherichia coli DEC1C]EHU06938.1 putative membrane protein [Escherichia coli DEC1B]EHU17884.1 putative membrane protein [Escherichia coli DEC1D]EHU21604.1 putative membrane protein [Escherichia coli DEC1E]EHU35086.1 putative membrane protein [Escherichia coli DEC2B]EHU36880.1 putative membrane protein [Escherichia coli DEC2C]EHU39379.1 putative membrane protein [Escherichia coli DEC2D]EHU50581.1 pu
MVSIINIAMKNAINGFLFIFSIYCKLFAEQIFLFDCN